VVLPGKFDALVASLLALGAKLRPAAAAETAAGAAAARSAEDPLVAGHASGASSSSSSSDRSGRGGAVDLLIEPDLFPKVRTLPKERGRDACCAGGRVRCAFAAVRVTVDARCCLAFFLF
jgi:hypothetical protein